MRQKYFLFIFTILFSIGVLAKGESRAQGSTRGSPSAISFLEKRLAKNNFPRDFVKKLLKHYDDSKREQVLKLNVMGFLIVPDYTGHVSVDGEQQCRDFLKEHSAAFQAAEKQFGVKKETIAALLWVETRLGANRGNFHVASVYLSLLQGDHSEMTKVLLADLEKKRPNPSRALVKKTKDRARIKGRWAVGELWALYKMQKLKPSILIDLKGSYSGAFGYAQFLPSSYIQWARSFKKRDVADLSNPNDAIMSVGNYLKKNGYRKGKPASYLKALFHYNRSHDYGDTILKLSDTLANQERLSSS